MSFKRITEDNFKNIRKSISIEKSNHDSMVGVESLTDSSVVISESFSTSPNNIIEYSYQNEIRPYFAKEGVNTHKIGTHPDLGRLTGLNITHNQYTVVMFIDIRRSSRLSVILPLEQAYIVKNRILQACIDIVRALDGYPHRLMGDALMAFFGRSDVPKENAIADALNAASTLRLILTDYIYPSLNEELGTDIDLGVRIGIDYGSEEEIIWGNFGLGDSSEVTAVGIPVDLSSKIQHLADKNTAMLGQGVLDFIDFPEAYTKYKESAGEIIRYVKPNLTNQEGKPINRKMMIMKMDSYQDLLPFKIIDKKMHQSMLHPSRFDYACEELIDEEWISYPSLSKFLNKNRKIKFTLSIDKGLGKMTVTFVKKNNGEDAKEKSYMGENYTVTIDNEDVLPGENSRHLQVQNLPDRMILTLPEATSYRGLHTMEVIVRGEFATIYYRNIIGVYIY